MLTTTDVIAFAASTNPMRARPFYQDVHGLRLVEQNAYACVFDANGTMLRITAVSKVAHPGYTVLGWRVAGMMQAVARLESRGIVFACYDGMEQDGHGVWTTPTGERIAWFSDPDENVLSLTEFG